MELKTNDILDVLLNINDENNGINYDAKYSLNGEFYSSVDMTMPKDSGYLDIEEWIIQDMDYFSEISDYEIFDITDKGDYQTAKIRIKALNETINED